jgi:hypothetical protein
MIRRNPYYAQAQQMRVVAQRAAQTPADRGRGGSSPATSQSVGGNHPVTGEIVMYGILGVTPASEDFRLKD